VAAAVVSLLGHVDGMEWTVGVLDFGGASALAAPRSRFGGLTWGQRAARLLGAVREIFQAKAQCLSVNDGDACGCRYPLGDVVGVILSALRLRVKTLDLMVSTAAVLCVATLLEASSWSPDFMVCLRWQVLIFRVLFYLLCKRLSSPPCISSPIGLYL
jgi:hypothetical protein